MAQPLLDIKDEGTYFTHDHLSILEQVMMQLIADSSKNILRQETVFQVVLGKKQFKSQTSILHFMDCFTDKNINQPQALNQ